jgi:cell division protein ZipA
VESLRWILLVAGAVFILVIYILGRNRRRRTNHTNDEAFEDDLPDFSAQDLEDFDEGVGEVKVVTGDGFFSDDIDPVTASADIDSNNYVDDPYAENEIVEEQVEEKQNKTSDIVVLYILPKLDQELLGAHINSSAQAMGLTFGEMNIFHYEDGSRNVFSLANMVEPGSFDPDTIHDLKTNGLTVFMKFSGSDPLDDLTEMLQRSYQLAGLLDARLCNHKREPLTEQDAENYRQWASNFINGERLQSFS